MAWARLDDALVDHPKIEPLSDRAFRAYIAGLCLCNRYLTDGVLTERQVAKIAPKRAREELISAGLWHPINACSASSGIRVHDFLEYNRDAGSVKAERRQNAERQKRWREGHRDPETGQFEEDRNAVTNASRNAVTDTVSNAKRNAAPPRPVPSRPVPGFVYQERSSLQTEASYDAGELVERVTSDGLREIG
jgi:hypothetical protein